MIRRRYAGLFAMAFTVACGGEDSTDSTSIASMSASSEDTGTDPSASTMTTTTTATTSPMTTSPADTSNSNSDDGPLETGPLDTGEDTAPPETGEDTAPPETGEDTAPPETGEDDGGALDMCLEMAADACEECACNSCLAELMACQADPGCVEIRTCAQENDCTGIACLGPCGDVINANGGPLGPSTGLASALSDCYEGACGDC